MPDVLHTKPTTLRVVTPIVGDAETFIVQTWKQKEQGDTVFLEHVSGQGTTRIVIPPAVVDTIVRQRDSLIARARSKASREAAAERKAQGIKPAFLRRAK